MECWGSVWKVFLGSLGGGRGGTGDRRKGHKQLAPTSPVEKHAHESGLLGIADVCAGCQRRDCCVRNGKGLPWGHGKILVQKEEQEDRKGVLCGGKWE